MNPLLQRGNGCVYPVKLKNLKANHNINEYPEFSVVLCISRKVKKSESKSQQFMPSSVV